MTDLDLENVIWRNPQFAPLAEVCVQLHVGEPGLSGLDNRLGEPQRGLVDGTFDWNPVPLPRQSWLGAWRNPNPEVEITHLTVRDARTGLVAFEWKLQSSKWLRAGGEWPLCDTFSARLPATVLYQPAQEKP